MVAAASLRRHGIEPSFFSLYEEVRSDWNAARPSAHRRRRSGLPSMGSNGDYHMRSEGDWLRVLELARDFIRNDCIVSKAIERLADNVQPEKFQVEPDTGDTGLDAELFAMWEEWANDRRQCDIYAERTFGQMARAAFTQSVGEGDILYVGLSSGELQGFEAHRIRTPQGQSPGVGRKSVVHGVEKNVYGAAEAFWITKEDIGFLTPMSKPENAVRYAAFDDEGDFQAFHVYRSSNQRISQTRGISALAHVVDIVDMHDDLQFAKLVQSKIVSCVAIIREQAAQQFSQGGAPLTGGPAGDERYGDRTIGADGRVEEEFAPGAHITGRPGEKITGFSPDVPNESFFQHSNILLSFIAIACDLPLIVMMLDATATNFSGFRGVENMARRGFGRMQRDQIERFHSPVYRHKLKQFADDNPLIRAARERVGKRFYRHEWNAPGWTYIQPVEDVAGDTMEVRSLMNSYRAIHARRGNVFEKKIIEQVEDCDTAIRTAVLKWQAFQKAFPDVKDVTWTNFLWLPTPDKVSATIAVGGAQSTASASPSKPQEASAE